MATKRIKDLATGSIELIDEIAVSDDSLNTDIAATLQQVLELVQNLVDCNNGGSLQSGLVNSEKSYTDMDYSTVINSLRTKADQNGRLVTGYGATASIAVPSEVIVTPAAPADGRSMAASGTWDGAPQGAGSPVYTVQIVSGTEFQWKKDAGAWSSAVTITGTGQLLSADGVIVTFSTTTGWTNGKWTITIDDSGYTANRTAELDSINGDLILAGTVTSSHTFTDLAEYFPNATKEVIPLGTIVTEHDGEVCPGSDGEHVLGVVSATAGIILGDSPFTWNGRFLRGDFGELLLDKNGNKFENPDYEPGLKNIPRSQRPDEWSCVALIGQVFTRLKERVKPGDYVDADGSVSRNATRLRCMKILKPYDHDKGYSVGLCIIY